MALELSEVATFYSPTGLRLEEALTKARFVGVGAHQDDLEFMCLHAIQSGRETGGSFFGIVVTDGAGSSRGEEFKNLSSDDFIKIREEEQFEAARRGGYLGVLLLRYPSAVIKKRMNKDLLKDLSAVLKWTGAEALYTHNPMDKHVTHVSVCCHVLACLRSIPRKSQPKKLFGCEVWRALDWVSDKKKVVLDISPSEEQACELVSVFKSQILGAKDYGAAVLGRKRANATFFESHDRDHAVLAEYAVDMTPLLRNPRLTLKAFVQSFLKDLQSEITKTLAPFQKR